MLLGLRAELQGMMLQRDTLLRQRELSVAVGERRQAAVRMAVEFNAEVCRDDVSFINPSNRRVQRRGERRRRQTTVRRRVRISPLHQYE